METTMTKPRYVIRNAGTLTADEYLQRDDSWGPYKTARRFKSQEAADDHARALDLNYGLFPCSVPTKRKRKRRIFEGTVYTCQHRVSFWYDLNDLELTDELGELLTEEAEDRAHHCICEGYHSGELNCLYLNGDGDQDEHEVRGWWSIES
jgi:hypothetical protein